MDLLRRSAVFHYLGSAFAVLLFNGLAPLGVTAPRSWSTALVFALWRRLWRTLTRLDAEGHRTITAWGAMLAAMNVCLYLAITRVPPGTVAAIEFLSVIVLAALGARTARNLMALVAAARMARSTYALLALLPVAATVIGIVVCRRLPSLPLLAELALVVLSVALHRELRPPIAAAKTTPSQGGKTKCDT
ncbi:hypothetical protein [Spirillospora sp. CA-128828]|uniref:hypothetical protein n=1 Tax=Spirillospora sp. CA-128828 TaxID=3240033 RepID=UPI003D8F4183